jgi:hypothetical protein
LPLDPAPLDPAKISKYSVIQVPIKFDEGSAKALKLFVVVCHEQQCLICLKATTRVESYKNDKERLAGCVYYKAHETVFSYETVIQPENHFAIRYSDIRTHERNGEFRVLGRLPSDFEPKIILAIENSLTISRSLRKKLIDAVKGHLKGGSR